MPTDAPPESRQVKRAAARRAAKKSLPVGEPKPFNPPPNALAGVVVSVVPHEPDEKNPFETELQIERFGGMDVDDVFNLMLQAVQKLYRLRMQGMRLEIDSLAAQAAAQEGEGAPRIWTPGHTPQ